MSLDRSRIAGWLGGVAGAGGAGIAVLVCCSTCDAEINGGLDDRRVLAQAGPV